MREIRQSGSEGGAGSNPVPTPIQPCPWLVRSVSHQMKAIANTILSELVGVMIGIVCSALLHGIRLTVGLYFATLLFSPLVLTLGLPLEFIHGRRWIGIATVIGLVGSVACFSMACIRKKENGWKFAAGVAAILWSLGSVFSMELWSGI